VLLGGSAAQQQLHKVLGVLMPEITESFTCLTCLTTVLVHIVLLQGGQVSAAHGCPCA